MCVRGEAHLGERLEEASYRSKIKDIENQRYTIKLRDTIKLGVL